MASNRTLLANLGFNDPDKTSKKHDLGCHFLAQPHILEKILKTLNKLKIFPEKNEIPIYDKRDHFKIYLTDKYRIDANLRTEVPITKGKDQYKQTIGFVDGIMEILIYHKKNVYLCENKNKHECPTECIWSNTKIEKEFEHCIYDINDIFYNYRICLYIETKITPQKLGDIIRQINLYREYPTCQCGKFILAYNFDLSEIEIKALEKENIICIKLSKQFDDWCAEQLNIKSEQKDNRLEF
jgi:hypothetical protein